MIRENLIKIVNGLVWVYQKLRIRKTYWSIAVPYCLFFLGELTKFVVPLAKGIELLSKEVENVVVKFLLSVFATYLSWEIPTWISLVLFLIFVLITGIKILENRNPSVSLTQAIRTLRELNKPKEADLEYQSIHFNYASPRENKNLIVDFRFVNLGEESIVQTNLLIAFFKKTENGDVLNGRTNYMLTRDDKVIKGGTSVSFSINLDKEGIYFPAYEHLDNIYIVIYVKYKSEESNRFKLLQEYLKIIKVGDMIQSKFILNEEKEFMKDLFIKKKSASIKTIDDISFEE